MQRFPTVPALADAPLDEVLHLWTGLGYYARARNLHRAAQQVRAPARRRVPARLRRGHRAARHRPLDRRRDPRASPAGARHAILDGNVKRVLARYLGIEGCGDARASSSCGRSPSTTRRPRASTDYTQAIMDLGATLCTRRRRPARLCPVAGRTACARNRHRERTTRRRDRSALPERETTLLLLRRDDGSVLLERRPPRHLGRAVVPAGVRDTEVGGRRSLRRFRARNRRRRRTRGTVHATFVISGSLHAARMPGRRPMRSCRAGSALV